MGRPVPDPAKFPAKSGVLVAPNESGATNFRPPSFDPRTGLFIVSAQDGFRNLFLQTRAWSLRLVAPIMASRARAFTPRDRL